MLKKQDGRFGLDSSGSHWGAVAGSFEQGSEQLAHMIRGNILDCYQLVPSPKKAAPWRYLGSHYSRRESREVVIWQHGIL